MHHGYPTNKLNSKLPSTFLSVKYKEQPSNITSYMYVTGPATINHVSTKNCRFFCLCLIITCELLIYTNEIKSLSLLQNLMGFLLKFTEMGYHIQS